MPRAHLQEQHSEAIMESTNIDNSLNNINGGITDNRNVDQNDIGEKILLADMEDRVDTTVVIEDTAKKQLIYGVSESPPIHVTIICGLQVINTDFF